MIGRASAVALNRPASRRLLVVALVAGGWAALGNGLATRVAGLLGGWLTAVTAATEVVLTLVVVGAAVGGSAWRSLGRDAAWHAAGVHPAIRVEVTAVGGSAMGLALLGAFSLGAGATGVVRAAVEGSGLWATEGYVTGTTTDVATLTARLVGGVAVLGALAAVAGRWTTSPGTAAVIGLVISLPFMTTAGGALGQTPALLDVLAASPVGAVRAVALGQQGLAVPGLERPAEVWPHAAALVVWTILLVSAEAIVGTRRPGPSAVRRRVGPRVASLTRRPIGIESWSRVTRLACTTIAVAGLVSVTVVIAATVPERANGSLPWQWQPAWRAAARTGRSSDLVVAAVVDEVRAGGPTPAVIPLPVVEVLRRGQHTEVARPAGMQRPDEVWVRVDLGDAVTTGDWVLEAVAVRFTLRDDGTGGWAITGADGPVAVAGTHVDDGSGAKP